MTRIALGGISLLTPLTGIGQYTRHLAQGLLNEGVEVELFLGHQWVSATTEFLQQPISGASTNPLIRRAWNKFKRHIPGARYTLHSLRQQTFTKGLLQQKDSPTELYHEPNFIPWATNHPKVISVHDLSWIRYPETHPADRVRWLNQALPQAINDAQKIIVVSDFVKQEIIDVFGSSYEKKITRVYNGVDESYQPYQARLHALNLERYQLKEKSYFLALGTLEPRKNLQTILEAYALLSSSIQAQYPLVLAGTRGWLNETLDKALKDLPAEHIKILGYVPQNDLPAITAGAKALLYASKYEGFGLPPLEAMASGTPVISSNAKAMVEVIAQAGFLLDPQDPHAFKEAMQTVIENRDLEHEMQTTGLARAQEFSWTRCARETLACYQDVLKTSVF